MIFLDFLNPCLGFYNKFFIILSQIDIIGEWGVLHWKNHFKRCHLTMSERPTGFIRPFHWPLARNRPYKDELSKR